MRKPKYKEIAADFLSRIVPADSDLCLDFHPTEASEILAKRINLEVATEKTDILARFGVCIGMEQPNISRMLKLARRVYFWFPVGRPMWKWIKAIQASKGKILYAQETNLGCTVYATAYVSIEDLEELASINVPDGVLEENIRANLSEGYREIEPHVLQPEAEVALVLGGPSINDFAAQIYEQAKSGIPVITANGAYNWCLEHKIIPAAQIICDARAFNSRFVNPVRPETKYLLCSQCDPKVLSSVPKDQIWMWHAFSDLHNRIVKDYYGETPHVWYPVPGGTTVGLRAIPLLLMLGYKKFHVYGFDSCIMGTHHGYVQTEDDRKRVMVVDYGGKKFNCYPWMMHQCNDFMKLTQHLIGPLCDMEIYGEGLIAHCIKTLAGEINGSDEMALLRHGETKTSERHLHLEHRPDAHGAVQEFG